MKAKRIQIKSLDQGLKDFGEATFLLELGLVDLGRPHGVRGQRRPTLVSDHIYVELAI